MRDSKCESQKSRGERQAKVVDNPEDWPRVFEQHLNAGDLDAVVALYGKMIKAETAETVNMR